MRVFISYATEDRGLAEQVHLALLGAGYETFFDKESLPPGDDFHSRINLAIAQSDAFVFLIGPHSISNGSYALTELKLARNKWKHPKGRVLPVVASKVEWEAIPNYLKAVTVLQPEGNLPAEVVIAVRNFGGNDKVEHEPNSERASGRSPNGNPGTEKIAKITVPLIVAVLGTVGTLGAAIITNWDKLFQERPQKRQDYSYTEKSSTTTLTNQNTALPSKKAIGYSISDLWCASSNEKNPIASRAAELLPPEYTIDKNRHLLLNSKGQPVSVVPAASLGHLEKLRFIVVHFSAGTALGAESYFQQPEAVGSVHVLIARDGTLKQLVPFDYASYNAGQSTWKGLTGLNRYSVGIDLENWGQLTRKNNAWISWSGHEVPDSEVLIGDSSQVGWQKYTEAQIRSFFSVACALRKAYPTIEEIVGHDQISPGRKTDPGPAFPLDEMQRHLFGGVRREIVVETDKGLGLQTE